MKHYPSLKDRRRWRRSRDEIQAALVVHIYPYWKWIRENWQDPPDDFNRFCRRELRSLPLKIRRLHFIRLIVGNADYKICIAPQSLSDVYIQLRRKL